MEESQVGIFGSVTIANGSALQWEPQRVVIFPGWFLREEEASNVGIS